MDFNVQFVDTMYVSILSSTHSIGFNGFEIHCSNGDVWKQPLRSVTVV